LEHARNVLKLMDADTAENMTDTENPVITPIACALPDRPKGAPKMYGTDSVKVLAGTRLRDVLATGILQGDYFCNYGVNEEYEKRFEEAGLRVSARGGEGEIRAVELVGHRFYVATLFQPQLQSTEERPHPVVMAFVKACVEFRGEQEAES
jgi:CTP synthase (UTP-ammonia lyase)